MSVASQRSRGFTLAEVLICLVVVAVLAALAVPMWRNHLLRVQRADAVAALIAVQSEQDNYFGRNARYADAAQLATPAPAGLGLGNHSNRGYYLIELRTGGDGLGYVATARVAPQSGQSQDTRCTEFTLDHNGRRRAQDADGNDRSARGSENTTCSSRPFNSSAGLPPHSRRRATTCCTSSSGADAPAVTPTAVLSLNHSRLRKLASSMR